MGMTIESITMRYGRDGFLWEMLVLLGRHEFHSSSSKTYKRHHLVVYCVSSWRVFLCRLWWVAQMRGRFSHFTCFLLVLDFFDRAEESCLLRQSQNTVGKVVTLW